ncbi:hypothetical protein KQX54_014737 [Cotesia glomerata]|uniref:Uncharacterized protein n=1 Tax=Cotesia glomerata TaxID=32391 RepID=A0AAV7HZN4_COTGL|nr:hypothetical protein KQX54_014737 [Cotesia glomerata]
MSFQEYFNAYVKRHVYKTKKCCQEEVGNTKTSDSDSTQVDTSALSVSNLECTSRTEISVHNVQHEESAIQNEITHTNLQLRDQDCNNELKPAGTTKRKTQPLVISDDEDEVTSTSTPFAVRPTPAQDAIKKEIDK